MINWWDLLTNAIWILGAALALAAVSLGYYQSQIENSKLKIVLKRAMYAIWLNMAGAVFALGMALTSDRWWEIGLWALLVGAFGWEVYQFKIGD